MLVGDDPAESGHRQSDSSPQETDSRSGRKSKSESPGADDGGPGEIGRGDAAKAERVDVQVKKQQFND